MHDRNGTPLQKGDVVLVEAKIVETFESPDYCNIQILIGFEKAHGPDNVHSGTTINSRQVVLSRR